jgi:hypothetical protein
VRIFRLLVSGILLWLDRRERSRTIHLPLGMLDWEHLPYDFNLNWYVGSEMMTSTRKVPLPVNNIGEHNA